MIIIAAFKLDILIAATICCHMNGLVTQYIFYLHISIVFK